MADPNPHEAALARAVHEAEFEVAEANAQPSGPQRIERINRADIELIKAGQRLDHYLSGQAGAPIKVER